MDANPAAHVYQFYLNDSFISKSSSGVLNITVDTDGVYTCVPSTKLAQDTMLLLASPWLVSSVQRESFSLDFVVTYMYNCAQTNEAVAILVMGFEFCSQVKIILFQQIFVHHVVQGLKL